MIRHVAGVGEVVEDVAAAAAFYRDVLGLNVEHEAGSDYAEINVPGILHWGLWDRRAAAESTFGDRALAARIPLGFCVGLEVDDVDAAAEATGSCGINLIQPPKTEPWGQKTTRFLTPWGSFCELVETPWAREIPKSGE
jgi:catechol 2,3-dioxygenase-like lactoylglutathione lyase family enzyme